MVINLMSGILGFPSLGNAQARAQQMFDGEHLKIPRLGHPYITLDHQNGKRM